MPRVITGTAKNKKYGVIKAGHLAGPAKIRCPGCKVGMCIEVLDSGGKTIMRCQRCGREHTFQEM